MVDLADLVASRLDDQGLSDLAATLLEPDDRDAFIDRLVEANAGRNPD